MRSKPLSVAGTVDWSAIRIMLKPGTRIDIQLNEFEPPQPYTVLMALDMPLFICRLAAGEELISFDPGECQLAFIPTARDLCAIQVVIKESAEDGRYLALTPVGNAEFMRRRRSIRIKTGEEIGYRVQFEGKSNIYKGVAVEDIGRGGIGLLVYAAGPVAEGAHATVRVSLPGVSEQVVASGEVSHCIAQESPRMYRVGIRFTKISPRDQQVIALYIDKSRKVEGLRSHT